MTRVAIVTSNTNMGTSPSTIYTFSVRKSTVRKILMHVHNKQEFVIKFNKMYGV
jgi:hypothetical protein